MTTSFGKSAKGGFTLIELLVVVAIIGVLATVVMAYLGGAKSKGSDAKIMSQIGQMNSQSFLFSGVTGTGYVVPTPYQISAGITGAAAGGTAASGTLFNDTTAANNSLYNLISKMPSSTYIYYGWDGVNLNTTGKWFFAAGTSSGAFCNDWRSEKKIATVGASPTTLANFTAVFPNATAAGGYLCN